MKNLPKVMSNMFGMGAGGRMLGDFPTFKITMKEYENMVMITVVNSDPDNLLVCWITKVAKR
jgi:hypothetical protein